MSVIIPHSAFLVREFQNCLLPCFLPAFRGSSRAVLSVWTEPPPAEDDASFVFLGSRNSKTVSFLVSFLPSAAATQSVVLDPTVEKHGGCQESPAGSTVQLVQLTQAERTWVDLLADASSWRELSGAN